MSDSNSEATATLLPYLFADGPRKPAPQPVEAWFDLAWRPAGSRSLGERWLRAGEPAPRPPARPRVIRKTKRSS